MTTFYIIAASIIGLFLIFLLIVSPSDRKHKDIGLLKGAHIAHRGLHDINKKIPENSLAAFQKAVDQNFPIEIDVHLTKDGRVVVFHDHLLKRICGAEGRVEEKTLDELKQLYLLNTSEKIPTLEEVLELVDGKVFLLIEFKMKNKNTKALCQAADSILQSYKGKYFVQSFYPQVLRWYKWHRRSVCRGLLAANFKNKGFSKKMAGYMAFNFLAKPDFIAYKHEDSKNPMRRFTVWLGAESVGWTFTSQKDINDKKNDFNTFIFEKFIPETK